MGYVYGNRESTFGEGRLSLFFAAMHLKEAADGRSCRYLGGGRLPAAASADKILFFVETVPANDLVGRVAAC